MDVRSRSSVTAGSCRGGGTQGAVGSLSKATAILAVLVVVGALALAIKGSRGPGSIVRRSKLSFMAP